MSKNPSEFVLFIPKVGGGGGSCSRQENFRVWGQNFQYISKLARNIDFFQCCLLNVQHIFVVLSFLSNFLSKSFKKLSFGTFKRKLTTIITIYSTLIFALLKVVEVYKLYTNLGKVFLQKFLKNKELGGVFLFYSLQKMHYSSEICKNFWKKAAKLPALLGRHRINQQRNGGLFLNLQRPNSGIIMMLVVLFVPIAFFSFKYSQKLFEQRQKTLEKTDGPFYRKYYPTKVALAMAKAWNPAKTVGNQQLDSAYEESFNSGIWCQNSALGGAIDGIILSNSGTTGDTSAPATSGPPDAPTTSAGKIAQAKKDIAIVIEDDKIKVTCNKKSAYALPAECDLDLVLAVPTNANAQVAEIGKASANFLKDNFYNTRGVYTSVIPYSGKLSLPSNRYDGWTEAFPAFSYKETLTLYDLIGTTSASGKSATNYNSAGNNNGYSIMYRDNLFDATDASASKYRRINIKPCTSFSLSIDGSGVVSPVYTCTYLLLKRFCNMKLILQNRGAKYCVYT